ncbi:nuclease-related [Anaeramoeba ignava]|uniref:Nuclease-related n=1 Tax=Anaeramoeba ignava TaxID=1746090 RepID=A0A9Q0LBB0_ANAIG|nr:nuclease-related [Anaeramoeba ignava]
MGKNKYFCEYCRKTFTNNREIRKQHQRSWSHQQNVRRHYRQYKIRPESKESIKLTQNGIIVTKTKIKTKTKTKIESKKRKSNQEEVLFKMRRTQLPPSLRNDSSHSKSVVDWGWSSLDIQNHLHFFLQFSLLKVRLQTDSFINAN